MEKLDTEETRVSRSFGRMRFQSRGRKIGKTAPEMDIRNGNVNLILKYLRNFTF